MQPDKLLGYIFGIAMGDGWLSITKSRNYNLCLETTRKDYAHHFANVVKSRFPSLSPIITHREKTRPFPNGQIYTSECYRVTVSSLVLYNALRPFKLSNFRWKLPLVLTTQTSLSGFLSGYFDAEGSIRIRERSMSGQHTGLNFYSKHVSNLRIIAKLLRRFNFNALKIETPSKQCPRLSIENIPDCERFGIEIGSLYFPKMNKFL